MWIASTIIVVWMQFAEAVMHLKSQPRLLHPQLLSKPARGLLQPRDHQTTPDSNHCVVITPFLIMRDSGLASHKGSMITNQVRMNHLTAPAQLGSASQKEAARTE